MTCWASFLVLQLYDFVLNFPPSRSYSVMGFIIRNVYVILHPQVMTHSSPNPGNFLSVKSSGTILVGFGVLSLVLENISDPKR